MYKIFSTLTFFFFAANFVSASVIPEGKCAIITGASKSKKDVLKTLKKYSNYVDPIAVESNNGYFAFSLGIYEKSESKSVLNEFKGKGLIPKDSYCGNVKRFIAILYPNKDYTALTDQPSNQNDSKELVDNSSSTSLELSNLRKENQNLKLRINSLINDNNKMRQTIVLLKKENIDIKEEFNKQTNNIGSNSNTTSEIVTEASNQNKQKDNIPKEKVDGLINFLGIDFSMSWNEMTSFVSKNLKQHKDHIRLNREKNLVEFYCKSFNGCETTVEKMLLAITKKYLFVPEFRNFPEGVMTISTGGGFKFMEGYCGSGKNGDTLCIYPELLKPNMVGAMYLFKDQFGKEKLNF